MDVSDGVVGESISTGSQQAGLFVFRLGLITGRAGVRPVEDGGERGPRRVDPLEEGGADDFARIGREHSVEDRVRLQASGSSDFEGRDDIASSQRVGAAVLVGPCGDESADVVGIDPRPLPGFTVAAGVAAVAGVVPHAGVLVHDVVRRGAEQGVRDVDLVAPVRGEFLERLDRLDGGGHPGGEEQAGGSGDGGEVIHGVPSFGGFR